MGKNIKSYATTQVHSPGKGREALRQKVQIFHLNMVRLNRTYYSLLNFTSKLFQNWLFRAKFKQIKQNLLNLPIYSTNYAKFAPIINLFILCFRGLPQQRTLRNSSELCKFRTVRPQSPRITRNSHPFVNISYVSDTCPSRELSAIPANYANSAQFAHTVHEPREIRQIC